jgi:hypothetical protein
MVKSTSNKMEQVDIVFYTCKLQVQRHPDFLIFREFRNGIGLFSHKFLI